MAEYKNGVNAMGNMSVAKDDVTSDIQTGRAVYIDSARYEADTEYKARIDEYVRQGFHGVSIEGR